MCILLAGCGGGGAPPAPVDNVPRSETLRWKQPPTFADNSPMDIHRDVARWDLYCSPFYPPMDNEIVASIVTPDNLSFDMGALRRYGISPGPEGYLVSLRCIGIDNQASAYSEPTWWEN